MRVLTDHPRVCGERSKAGRAERWNYGSSPRVRGTLLCVPFGLIGYRIIPACAGNVSFPEWTSPGRTDHPRVCGERIRVYHWVVGCVGSSPRVRGTRGRPLPKRTDERIIPACAGNAPLVGCTERPGPDHPRVCGERGRELASGSKGGGSSPRVRGTPPSPLNPATLTRIIPACAGNAYGESATAMKTTDHPRVCGERVAMLPVVRVKHGSSPRVRGTHRAARAASG